MFDMYYLLVSAFGMETNGKSLVCVKFLGILCVKLVRMGFHMLLAWVGAAQA